MCPYPHRRRRRRKIFWTSKNMYGTNGTPSRGWGVERVGAGLGVWRCAWTGSRGRGRVSGGAPRLPTQCACQRGCRAAGNRWGAARRLPARCVHFAQVPWERSPPLCCPSPAHTLLRCPVLRAVLRYEISHPVVNDGNMALWRALGVSSWPTLAVVSPQGRLLGMLPGGWVGG